ncbi:MAG: sugar phosphate isomerase/epimerase [Phaeodactylibacter sp.]|uniref:sugar phosphate isomerase/epimerase family protein n=1 Tax=Phaeodactylibacter sp. TaxID=1940289 RepID=UPI0032EEDE2F
MQNRRKFIKQSTKAAVAAALLPYYGCSSGTGDTTGAEKEGTAAQEMADDSHKLDKFGIQLWTLRDIIADDPKGVLRALSEFGYQQIESYEGKDGIFWGMSNTEYKAYLDELGMEAISSHCNINKDFEQKAQQAGEIGMPYLICPYIGMKESLDDYKRVVDQFNECGAICKKYGLRFGYHNHDYSFQELDGQIIQDYMMKNTDPDTVDFEMDIYWVVTGGADPIAYLEQYPGRFKLSHVKDRIKDVPADERAASCILGNGSIDHPKILDIAEKQGMKYFIVEQERYDECAPIDCAKADADYLKGIKI